MALKQHIYILIITTTLLSVSAKGQTHSQAMELIEVLIEEIAQQSQQPQDYTTLLNDLCSLLQNPLDLNKSSANELEKLYILTKPQIKNLIAYREKAGKIYTIYELQLIPGYSYELIQKIGLFVTLDTSSISTHNRSSGKRSSHQLLLRLQRTIEKEEGYRNYSSDETVSHTTLEQKKRSRYLGNPWKYYSRYTFTSKNKQFTGGITAEKDAGEPFLKSPIRQGFDYYSFHTQWRAEGIIKQINLGDYQLQYGQGLCLWSGLSQKKSVYTVHHAKKSQGTRPYRSSDENMFFRGLAIQWKPVKNIDILTFISHKKRDAHIAQTDTLQPIPPHATSLPNSGLHRNLNELSHRHQLKESVWGGNLEWNPRNFQAGFTFLGYRFTPPLIPPAQTFRFHDFSGNYNHNWGAHYQFHYRQLHFFGEIAFSRSGGTALLQGIQAQAHSKMEIELLYRKYTPNYQALYANGFSEQSSPKNEEGFYLGAIFNPFPKWKVSAYFDYYRFPWLRFRNNAPGKGHDLLAQIEYLPSSKTNLYIKFKKETTSQNQPTETGISTPEPITKQQLRFHINYTLNNQWTFRNRFEISSYQSNHQKENGYLLYQDIICRPPSSLFSASFRLALFCTDSYKSRIYAYENDILYAFSIPPYYDKGTRSYITVRYPMSKKADIYLRLAQTRFHNRSTISSGTSEIQGNTKSELKLLFRLKL